MGFTSSQIGVVVRALNIYFLEKKAKEGSDQEK